MRVIVILLAPALFAQPVRSVWIHSAPASSAVAGIRPDVHGVESNGGEIVVRSAGISLAYLGPLAVDPNPAPTARQFSFRIPVQPRPEMGPHAHIPADYAGVFVNGVPIPNHFEYSSYRGQNLWHFDGLARSAKSAHAPPPPGLLEGLLPGRGRHSPIIGYALDGYPVYGPWSSIGRMRSSYRLRQIPARNRLPDGTLLAPGQDGPPVNSEYPLGAFVEDYEYIAGAGNLDQYNGRFMPTPEYPDGTYAYFLSTGADGALAFPYILATEFKGQFGTHTPLPIAGPVSFRYDPPGRLHFQFNTSNGKPIRHLEFVHERPLHVLIVSHDLANFAHIHPAVNEQGVWQVEYQFPKSGHYRIYADFTLPGAPQRVEHFDVDATVPTRSMPASVNPGIALIKPDKFHAGADTDLLFQARNPIPNWRPYLGAWAHVIIAGDGLGSFQHAHPIEQLPVNAGLEHTHENLGPPPRQIRVAAMFPRPGHYKLWFQMQVGDKVETVPFEITVDPAIDPIQPVTNIPKDAIAIRVSAKGFEPARIEIPANHPVKLAIHRDTAPNCGSGIAFPALGLTRALPPGGVAIIHLPPQPAGELRFTCGMGMYRGSVVAVLAP